MEYIRRCALALLMATFAACSTIQAPPAVAQEVQTVITLDDSKDIPQEVDEVEVRSKGSILAEAIASRFKCSLELAKNIVALAEEYGRQDFPTVFDILAVIAIESSFNPFAKQGGSFGLMQVLLKTHRKDINQPFDEKEQIRVGSKILNEYYDFLNHNRRSAIMAYNVGPGAYLKGSRPNNYYTKFLKEQSWLKKLNE